MWCNLLYCSIYLHLWKGAYLTKLDDISFEFSVKSLKALFLNPVEKNHSYLVPTYSALRYLCECIYWTPEIEWVIDKVRIMASINAETETGTLKDVHYQVRAHMAWKEDKRHTSEQVANTGKFLQIAKRSMKRGGRRTAYMGKPDTEDFLATIEPCLFGEGYSVYDIIPEVWVGEIFHSTTYPKDPHSGGKTKTQHFFNCILKNGVIDFPHADDCKTHRNSHYWQENRKG